MAALLPRGLCALALLASAAHAACPTTQSCTMCETYNSQPCMFCPSANGTLGACVPAGASCASGSTPVRTYSDCSSLAPSVSQAQIDGVNALAEGQSAGSITGAAVVSLLFAGLLGLGLRATTANSEGPEQMHMREWKEGAARFLPLAFCAVSLQALSFLAGFAALVAPVAYGYFRGGSLFIFTLTGTTIYNCASASTPFSSCATQTYPGTLPVIWTIGLVLALSAILVAAKMSVDLRRVARFGQQPGRGCCRGGVPVVQGLAWGALILLAIGTTGFTALIFLDINTTGIQKTLGASYGLMCTALAACFLACVLFSVICCCGVGSMPGVGTSRSNCCCTAPLLEGANARSNDVAGLIISGGGGGEVDLTNLALGQQALQQQQQQQHAR